MSEAGVPGIDATVWWGFVAPAGTPREVVNRLNAEINKALADPSIRERLDGMGVLVTPWSAEQFGAFLKAETDKWATVIKGAGIRAD
jgi:tripartite-type tricarboxylate transporter receptor subunit TctC